MKKNCVHIIYFIYFKCRYIGAYQRWNERRKKYEHWKLSQNEQPATQKVYSEEELKMMKANLQSEPLTYEEWMGLKHREQMSN